MEGVVNSSRIVTALFLVATFHLPALAHELERHQTVDQDQITSTSVTIEIKGESQERTIECFGGQPGSTKTRKDQLHFTSFKQQLKRLKAKDNPKKKKIRTTRKLKLAGEDACKQALPSPTPAGYFELNGDMTELGREVYEVPEGVGANSFDGKAVYQSNCIGCHEERTNRTFPALRLATSRAPMSFDETTLVDQDLANLVAYLNRNEGP